MRRVTDLSPAKQSLLEKWTRDGAVGGTEMIPAARAAGPIPLSFVQERQLFLELLDPLTAVNNLAVCLRIDGRLDVVALEQSANRIIARHETLCTSFDLSRCRPASRFTPGLTIELPVADLERRADRYAEGLRLAEAEARRPFDLTLAPLLRAKAFRLTPDRHILVIVVHHTIADGWSLGVLLRELLTTYHVLVNGRRDELAPLPIQYRDFAVWQRDPSHAATLARQLDFWKDRLAGELPVLDLPIDHPRGPRQTFGGAVHRFLVPASLTASLKELSRRSDATVFMTLMAAWQALLHRYTLQDDILVGTPIAGRTRPETQGLIGAFINTLVIRTDLGDDPTFHELLRRVRDVALAAFAHQDLPFERLVAELRPQRDLSRTPIFQVMFILQNSPLPELEIDGLSLHLIPLDRGATQFDLTLLVGESREGLECTLEYNSDLFDRSTVERLASSYQLILERAVACPEARLSALPTMTEAEEHRLAVETNRTGADYPRELCVHELFEAQVKRTPMAVAVVCDGVQLSYRDLEWRANQLAGVLQARGIRPGARVGVCLERSFELVVALLATLKSGGAYVPIDPSLPSERVRYLLQDSGAAVLLTDDADRSDVPVETLVIGRSDGVALSTARTPLRRATTPSDPVYLIYTSGSTGQPKGVLVPHASLVNVLWFFRQLLGAGASGPLLAVTSVSFDIAALELYLPLVAGGTVVLASREMTLDHRRLQVAILEHRVQVMQATPSMWRMMVQGGWEGAPDLIALCGGEALTPELAGPLVTGVGSLWNVYGPTETTVWSSAWRVEAGQPITIGRPIANTQLYVLDARRCPCPIGVTGELYIGGDGVALGYQNQPELTSERFITMPSGLAGQQCTRLFKTRDLTRWRPDGAIELVGRIDSQIKLNGFRIEPAEIESALCRHASIREAAVVLRERAAGHKCLVAYVVPEEGEEPEPAEVREFLRTILPAYMVPAMFVSLPRLPLTASGKVDRRALPPPQAAGEAGGLGSPGTPLEARLAGLYAEALGLPLVGIHDNFFDMGGGSIQILEIVARADAVGITLSPDLFFEHQTVAALAAHLCRTGTSAVATPMLYDA